MEKISKEILITGDSLLTDIGQQFSLFYPFLKIEFSKKNIFHFKKNKLQPGVRIKQLTTLATPVKVNVDNNITIAELEKMFSNLLHLSVQVFRKSGNVWNAISLTDSWTLESQNKAGEFISTEVTAAS